MKSAPGTHRFQLAVVEKDVLIGIMSPRSLLASLGDYCLRSRASGPGALRASDEPSARDCALEAMRAQGFSLGDNVPRAATPESPARAGGLACALRILDLYV